MSATHSAGFSDVGAASTRLEVCLGLRQGLGKRRGVALIGRVQLGRHHRAGVQIHRVPGLVGQMRRAVLHLGDLGLGVALETQSVLESFLRLRFDTSGVRIALPDLARGLERFAT